MRPWIYRRYLTRADISGIKALKRRIEQQAGRDGGDERNVKTGRGGIRDVEFAIQFLQLLNGGDLPALRTTNTLEAIVKLESVGCLTNQERTLLEENYVFLRRIEHLLQIMFDLQTHMLPAADDGQRKLALRMGYADAPGRSAKDAFWSDFRNKTDLNRKMLDHLLHDAFGDDAETEAESDLVLDPDPPPERVAEVLGKYPFRDVPQAHRNLTAPGEEKIRFLSTPRCRHFLASIAPRLLEAIAATADPDSTLVNLDKVSDSLGGKGVLWELFSFNPPSLRLYVELCAYSPYLSAILTSNPGMIDGLMDSLVLDKLPSAKIAAADVGRSLPRGGGHRPRAAQLQERPAALRRRARPVGQGGRAGDDRGALRHRRDLPGADRRLGIRPLGLEVRPAADRRRAPRRTALRNGHFGPGQVRRPGNELPQRPRHRLPLRGRGADGLRIRPQPRIRHDQPAFLQRTRPADHQDDQPPERLRQAVRGRRAASPHRQERLAGDGLAGVRPLFHPRIGAALGAAGAVQGAAGLRLAAGDAGGAGGDAPRRLRPPLAPQGRRRDPPHEATPRRNRRPGRPEARAGRHRRRRVPRADVSASARAQVPPPPHARHAGRAGRACAPRD